MAQSRIIFKSDSPPDRSSDYLAHFGIKGMKWGVRRFQDANGHLTEEGKKRYSSGADELKKEAGDIKKFGKEYDRKVKAGLYDNDPELRELYIMERMESRKLTKDLDKFDSMNDSDKRSIGDRVLNYVKNIGSVNDDDTGLGYDRDLEDDQKKVTAWLGTQISRKSGTATTVGSQTEANKVAKDQYNKNLDQMKRRNEEVKKEIGFKSTTGPIRSGTDAAQKNRQEVMRLTAALNGDKIYAALEKQRDKLADNWSSVVLKDLGFNDTAANRAVIWPYIIEVWD